MAEAPSKRPREETHVAEDCEDPKRHKSYNHILSLLEDEEADEPNQDFSSILTTLQRELSCDSSTFEDLPSLPGSETEPDGDNPAASSEPSPSSHGGLKGSDEEEEDERVRVMRHLLEASDDELGIPNRADGGGGEVAVDGGDAFSLCDGLWELEDEAANYYALLQSELFM